MAVGLNVQNPIRVIVHPNDDEIIPSYQERGYQIISDETGAIVLGEGANQVTLIKRVVVFIFQNLNH